MDYFNAGPRPGFAPSVGLDEPPFSRLFVMSSSTTTEKDITEAFSKIGNIETLHFINKEKGLLYVKMTKASEAALCVEKLSRTKLAGHDTPIKVMIASPAGSGKSGPRESAELYKQMHRLFISVPLDSTKTEIRTNFEKYGNVEDVFLHKDRQGKNKGSAYVNFESAHIAALAKEQCDPRYNAKFADPPQERDRFSDRDRGDPYFEASRRDSDRSRYGMRDRSIDSGYQPFSGYMGSSSHRGRQRSRSPLFMGHQARYDRDRSPLSALKTSAPASGMDPLTEMLNYPSLMQHTELEVAVFESVSETSLSRLFSIIPGMEYCRLTKDYIDVNGGLLRATIKYCSPQCAAYARDRLNGFDFPTGHQLAVQFSSDSTARAAAVVQNPMAFTGNRQSLAMNIPPPPAAVPRPMGNSGFNQPENRDVALDPKFYCNIENLPPRCELLPRGTKYEMRLFVVAKPLPVAQDILIDLFSRFGNLVDVYIVRGKNYGYVSYAKSENAEWAMKTVDKRTVAGSRLTVVPAEDKPSTDGKQSTNGSDEQMQG